MGRGRRRPPPACARPRARGASSTTEPGPCAGCWGPPRKAPSCSLQAACRARNLFPLRGSGAGEASMGP
eukprot:2429249-Lingulodinium_polyedra.AAC.1